MPVLTAQRRVSRAGGLKRVKVVFDRACKSRHIQLLDGHTACSADERYTLYLEVLAIL